MSQNGKAEFKTSLNQALAGLVDQRVTLFHISWQVSLLFPEPGAGQVITVETPFNIGAPGDEELVVPGRYSTSIAKVIGLLGETVTAVSIEPTAAHLRLSFSNGSGLVVVVGEGWPEWEFHSSSGPDRRPWFVNPGHAITP